MSSESDLEDDGKHVNFFMLTKDEQSLFANPVISLPRFEIHAPVHRRQLQDIAWQADFEGDLGILEYTRLFVRTQEKELVVVTRRGVERSWGEKVKERFGDDEDKKEVFRGQVSIVRFTYTLFRNGFAGSRRRGSSHYDRCSDILLTGLNQDAC